MIAISLSFLLTCVFCLLIMLLAGKFVGFIIDFLIFVGPFLYIPIRFLLGCMKLPAFWVTVALLSALFI